MSYNTFLHRTADPAQSPHTVHFGAWHLKFRAEQTEFNYTKMPNRPPENERCLPRSRTNVYSISGSQHPKKAAIHFMPITEHQIIIICFTLNWNHHQVSSSLRFIIEIKYLRCGHQTNKWLDHHVEKLSCGRIFTLCVENSYWLSIHSKRLDLALVSASPSSMPPS